MHRELIATRLCDAIGRVRVRQLHRSLLTLCCLVHHAIARYTSTSAATTQHTQLHNSSRHLRASPLITAAIDSERSRRREFSRGPEPEYTLPRETAIRTVRAPAAITPLSLARRPLIKREFPNFPRLRGAGPKRGGGTHGPSLDALGVVRIHGSGQILARTTPGPVRPP